MRSEYDTANSCDCGLADIESFLDHRGAQHEKTGETSEDDVDQMRSIDAELIPRHDCCITITVPSLYVVFPRSCWSQGETGG